MTESAVRAKFEAPSGILLTPIGDGVTRTQICINVDPDISVVPSWLIDFGVRHLAYLIVVAIRRAVEIVKGDPEYARRMSDESSEFYNHVRRRLRESLPSELDRE